MLSINEMITLSSRLACLAGLLLYPIAGCGDVGSGEGGAGTGGGGAGGLGGSGGSDGSGGSGGVGGQACTSTEPVSFFLKAFPYDEPEAAVEDVLLCELENRDNCVLTDANGKAVLELPACQEVGFTVEKEGYRSWLNANVTDDTLAVDGGIPMHTHEQTAAFADQLQTAYPWEGGAVALVSGVLRGVTFTPVGSTVGEVGELSYFDAATRKYDPELEGTAAIFGLWDLPLGAGGFVGITPGVQEFEFGGGAGECTNVSWGWPGSGPNRLRLPVLEGFTTYGSMDCGGF